MQIHVGLGELVEVAVCQQRPHDQLQVGAARAAVLDGVADERAVLSLRHEDLLGEDDVAHAVAEARPRTDGDAAQVFVSVRIEAAGMLTAGDGELHTVFDDFFFQRGKQHVAPCRLVEVADVKTVILARVAADDRARGVIAAAVRLQPLKEQRFAQVQTLRLVKLKIQINPSWSENRRFSHM